MDLGIEVDDLRKGDVIGDKTIRKIIGKITDPVEFIHLRFLWTEKVKAQLFGRGLTACIAGDELLILNDSDAAKYNINKFNGDRRKMKRRHSLMKAIDRSKLSDEEKLKYDRELLKQSTIIVASNESVREMPRAPYVRSTPAVRFQPDNRTI